MKFSVQTDNLKMLNEATSSDCDKVRFGSEFCAWKLPSLKSLEKAYEQTLETEKKFIYITPRVPEKSLKVVEDHLKFLDGNGANDVVINDWGVLNILEKHPNLRIQIGRQLVYMPARCPWSQEELSVAFSDLAQGQEIFNQTNLNYLPTIQFLQNYNIKGADVDWIPESFQNFNYIVRSGLQVSIYLNLIPVAITRSCHTARYLGEDDPENCSRPCDTKAFKLKQKQMGIELYLLGNVAYRMTQPSQTEIETLNKIGVKDIVISINTIMKTGERNKLNALIQKLNA